MPADASGGGCTQTATSRPSLVKATLFGVGPTKSKYSLPLALPPVGNAEGLMPKVVGTGHSTG